MANPEIRQVNLNNARVLVGPKKEALRGAADDFFVISPGGDVGGMVTGIQGDVTLFTRLQNGENIAFTFMQGSSAIKVLLRLARVGEAFPIAIDYDDYGFNGWAVLVNKGDVAASLGTMTRTITLAMAYQSGNVDTGIGRAVNG